MWPFAKAKAPVARAEPKVAALSPSDRRMRLHDVTLAASAITDHVGASPEKLFKIPPPPPGMVPKGRQTMAQDDAFAPITAWGISGFAANGAYAAFGGLEAFRGYPYLAELAQRPEYRRGVEIIAKEMTRKWIKLHSKADDDSKDERVGQLFDAMEKFRVQDVFREAAEHDGFFGRGQIFIDFDDGDAELGIPLIVKREKIRKGSLKRLKAIEPYWTYPGAYNASNPLHPHFYNPETWYVQGTPVHKTRLLPMVSREVPDILKPAYLFGGLSLTQMAEPYVLNWLRARQSVSDLMNAFSVMCLKTNMSTTLAGEADTDLMARVVMFNRYRNNRGTFVLDKEQEDLANVSASLGGLDHLQAQAQEHMASVFGVPLVKLFGITPSGLNASSDGEIRAFYDTIKAMQQSIFATPLRTILDIIQLSEFGEIDPEITFSFEPLWEASELELSTIRKTQADTAAVYIADGVLATEEVRFRLAREEDGEYNGLDLSIVPEPPQTELEPKIGPGEKEDGDPDEPSARSA